MARKKIKYRPVYRKSRRKDCLMKTAVKAGVGLAVLGVGLSALKEATK